MSNSAKPKIEKYFEATSPRRQDGSRKWQVLVWSDQGTQMLGTPVAPEMMPPQRRSGTGFRWGENAGEELEAGADLLAFALLIESGVDKHEAVKYYRYVARLMLHEADDYWLMTSKNLLNFVDKLKASELPSCEVQP